MFPPETSDYFIRGEAKEKTWFVWKEDLHKHAEASIYLYNVGISDACGKSVFWPWKGGWSLLSGPRVELSQGKLFLCESVSLCLRLELVWVCFSAFHAKKIWYHLFACLKGVFSVRDRNDILMRHMPGGSPKNQGCSSCTCRNIFLLFVGLWNVSIIKCKFIDRGVGLTKKNLILPLFWSSTQHLPF